MTNSQDLRTCRIAGLALANAMVFHEMLADSMKGIKKLRTLLNDRDPIGALSKEWRRIIKDIDYVDCARQ